MDAGNPSDDQWRALFDFIKDDDEMKSGLSNHPTGKARMLKKWSALAIVVNSVEGATAIKDGKQWKAAWNGMKSRARAAYRKVVKPIVLSGLPIPPLDEVKMTNVNYRKVLDLIGVPEIDDYGGDVAEQLNAVNAPNTDNPANNDDVDVPAGAAGFNQTQALESEGTFEQDFLTDLFQSGPKMYEGLPIIDLTAISEDNWGEALGVKEEVVDAETLLSDSPVYVKKEQLFHTPPNKGSGFTPAAKRVNKVEKESPPVIDLSDTPVGATALPLCKRRLDRTDDNVRGDRGQDIVLLQAAIEKNTNVLMEVLQALKRL